MQCRGLVPHIWAPFIGLDDNLWGIADVAAQSICVACLCMMTQPLCQPGGLIFYVGMFHGEHKHAIVTWTLNQGVSPVLFIPQLGHRIRISRGGLEAGAGSRGAKPGPQKENLSQWEAVCLQRTLAQAMWPHQSPAPVSPILRRLLSLASHSDRYQRPQVQRILANGSINLAFIHAPFVILFFASQLREVFCQRSLHFVITFKSHHENQEERCIIWEHSFKSKCLLWLWILNNNYKSIPQAHRDLISYVVAIGNRATWNFQK